MKNKIHLFLFFISLLTAGCFRNDIRTEVFQVETMQREEDVQTVAAALQQAAGILNIAIHPENRTVTVELNSRIIARKNIEHMIVQAGLGLPNRPLDP